MIDEFKTGEYVIKGVEQMASGVSAHLQLLEYANKSKTSLAMPLVGCLEGVANMIVWLCKGTHNRSDESDGMSGIYSLAGTNIFSICKYILSLPVKLFVSVFFFPTLTLRDLSTKSCSSEGSLEPVCGGTGDPMSFSTTTGFVRVPAL